MFGFGFIINILAWGGLIIFPLVQTIRDLSRFITFRRNGKLAYKTTNAELTDDQILDEMDLERPAISEWPNTYPFAEILFMGVAPLAGIGLVFAFSGQIDPFSLPFFPAVIPFIALPYLAYWLSRIAKKNLPFAALEFLPVLMRLGIIFYLIMGAHFLISYMTLMGLLFLPYLGFALIAPIPAVVYIWIETHRNARYIQALARIDADTSGGSQNYKTIPLGIQLLWIGVIVIVAHGIFHFSGLGLDALYQAFVGGEGFLFSFEKSNIW